MKAKTPNKGSIAEIGRGLGISRSTAHALVAKGMPTTSVAAAKDWRAAEAKRAGRRGPKPKSATAAASSEISTPAPKGTSAASEAIAGDGTAFDSLERLRKRIERQTKMADETQARFEKAMKADDIPAAKAAGETNNATQKTLIMLETEYNRRLLEAGTIVTIESAVARFQGVLADLREFIDNGESEFATLSNPDNPARGVVGYRAFKQKFYQRMQRATTADV